MVSLRNWLITMRLHKPWAWLGILIYACAVTFPHQPVQNIVGEWGREFTLKRVYQGSVAIAFIETVVLTYFFVRNLRQQRNRGWLALCWLISFALMIGTWRLFTANNTELVHYPQYFPEGVALLALTLSPAESLAWIAIFGGLDEAYQYTYLVTNRPVPFDFNDVYMDLAGGAAGVIFAIAVLGWNVNPFQGTKSSGRSRASSRYRELSPPESSCGLPGKCCSTTRRALPAIGSR